MDRDTLLRKAHWLLSKCRSEDVEPLGWGISPELWSVITEPFIRQWVRSDGTATTLYGLPVEVDNVYTDLSLRII